MRWHEAHVTKSNIHLLPLQENNKIVVKNMCGLIAHGKSVGQTHTLKYYLQLIIVSSVG